MLKRVFFLLLVRPLILFVTGLHIVGREHLPQHTPCIIAANHNSHMDTLVLMSLFPLARLPRVRPVAAADYFLKNKWVAWFSAQFIGIIPISRKATSAHDSPLAAVNQALAAGQTIIIFPEGSRGQAETLSPFKTGVAHLAKAFPHIPVVPVYIDGAGKVLPKGEALFVPFVMDVHIGEPLYYSHKNSQAFVEQLATRIQQLRGFASNEEQKS